MDDGYGYGHLTLSALAAEGMDKTFCGSCYLGICSAGHAGGHGSKEREYLVDHVMRSGPQDEFVKRVPAAKTWSSGDYVKSPLVVGQTDKTKQYAVEDIRQWYMSEGVDIPIENVFFFGDRMENMEPFAEKNFSAREISCGSRDEALYEGTNMVGYCGARPEEIVRVTGISNCVPKCQSTPGWTNGNVMAENCRHEGYGSDAGCTAEGWTCEGYEHRGWCAKGRVTHGSEFAMGAAFNYPELNCCACGGGSVQTSQGTCKPADIRRRRRGGGSSRCSCRRRSTSNGLPAGYACNGNVLEYAEV